MSFEVRVTRETTNMSKAGNGKIDSKQRKIDAEESGSSKRVTFKVDETDTNKEVIECMRKELSVQLNKEMKRMEEDWKVYKEYIEKRWVGRTKELKTKIEEINKKIKECWDKIGRWEYIGDRREDDAEGSVQSDKRSGYAECR